MWISDPLGIEIDMIFLSGTKKPLNGGWFEVPETGDWAQKNPLEAGSVVGVMGSGSCPQAEVLARAVQLGVRFKCGDRLA